jgi:hypothetical protein
MSLSIEVSDQAAKLLGSPEPPIFNKWKKRVMELSDNKSRYQSECLRCGETMFFPEWSGYLDRYRIQHLWECEGKTLVSLSHS